jgi:hypothetical protein
VGVAVDLQGDVDKRAVLKGARGFDVGLDRTRGLCRPRQAGHQQGARDGTAGAEYLPPRHGRVCLPVLIAHCSRLLFLRPQAVGQIHDDVSGRAARHGFAKWFVRLWKCGEDVPAQITFGQSAISGLHGTVTARQNGMLPAAFACCPTAVGWSAPGWLNLTELPCSSAAFPERAESTGENRDFREHRRERFDRR